MKKLFQKFIKNKYFIFWIILFTIILYIIFNPLLRDTTEYMQIRKITEYRYIFYVFLLPMSFYDMGFSSCMFLELSFFSIVSYISVSFINLFFRETSTVTLIRLGRDKWINELININLKFSIALSFLYIIFFYILCIKNNIVIDIELSMLIPIIYKIIIVCIIPLIFINVFINTNSEFASIIVSIVSDLFLQLIIKISFLETTLTFKYSFIIIPLLILFYYLMRKVSINNFKRRDV